MLTIFKFVQATETSSQVWKRVHFGGNRPNVSVELVCKLLDQFNADTDSNYSVESEADSNFRTRFRQWFHNE